MGLDSACAKASDCLPSRIRPFRPHVHFTGSDTPRPLSMHPETPDLSPLSPWAPELAQAFVTLASDIALVLDERGVIRTVAQGKRFVTPELAQMLVDNLQTPGGEAPHQTLSNRELQVMVKLAGGKRPADIATELNLSVKTVYVYRDRVKQKLSLSNDAEFTMYALRHGLIQR